MKRIKTLFVLAGTFCVNLIVLAIFFGPAWSCADFAERRFIIEPELQPVVEQFFNDALSHGKLLQKSGLIVRLGKIEEGGIKGFYYSDSKTIVIDRDFFNKEMALKTLPDSDFVKLVCYHELGHWMGQTHRGGTSTMNTGVFFDGNGDFIGTLRLYYASKKNQEAIDSELFNHQ